MEQKIIANQMSVSQQKDGHWLNIKRTTGKEYCCRIESIRDELLREALLGCLEDARQTYMAVVKEERPDIGIAILSRAIDEWYEKGIAHGKLGRTPDNN